ncbi:hypothetical protein [Rhodohalobacter sp.]|uniref:hypothetical protein n=1 Tax=Rhodohalobacter sp. TaxID=1974210 RepID=UPI002ACEAA51|nr:hypothetical protein [Rhodohalobacter sp.]MDZ7754842.1 hypothetical protein [Rhodohalobacter sp.]
MDSVRFTGDDKYVKIYNVFLILLGLFLLVGAIYRYKGGYVDVDFEWFTHIFAGIYGVAAGSSVIFGNKKPLSAIIIDNEKISSESPLESSFKWAHIKKIELDKKRINLQYLRTGITGTLKIPFTLRFKNLDRLSTALAEMCDSKEIEFVNKLEQD